MNLTLNLVQVLGFSEGTYVVTVNYAGVTTNTSFSLESKIIQIDDDVDSVFSIQTDESEYLSRTTNFTYWIYLRFSSS